MDVLKIGARLFAYKESYRTPHTREDWLKHWRPATITGETRVSWIITYDGAWKGTEFKVKKKDAPNSRLVLDMIEAEREWWADHHRYKIADEIKWRGANNVTFEQLAAIAKIIGYKELPP